MENNENIEDVLKYYTSTKITLTSGIISIINCHLLNSISNFLGVLLGNAKITKINKPLDRDENHYELHLFVNIENIIMIDKSEYKDDKLGELLAKLCFKFSSLRILGVLSGKANSFPKISLKEQLFYFQARALTNAIYQANNLFQNEFDSKIPFLFATFTNGDYVKQDICYKTFDNKIYYYANRVFTAIKFEINNVKSILEYQHLNVIPSKVIGLNLPNDAESNTDFLLGLTNKQLSFMKNTGNKEFNEILSQLYTELKEYRTLEAKLKKLELGS